MPIKPAGSRIGRAFVLSVMATVVTACATPPPIGRLHRGMTYASVAAILGPAQSSFDHADGHVSHVWALPARGDMPIVYSVLFDPGGRLIDIAGPPANRLAPAAPMPR